MFRFWRRPTSPSTIENPEASTDRRIWDRVLVDRPATYHQVNTSEQAAQGRIRNISRGGVSLFVERPLQPATLLSIELPHADGEPITTVLACVLRCVAEGNGFAVGCSFSSELGDAEIAALGARKEPAPSADQRTWTRFPAHGFALYEPMPIRAGSEPRRAEITNISPSGVGLILPEAIAPGVVLSLGLRQKDGEHIYQVLACVVYLRERETRNWIAGCHFIHELPERDFKQLM